MSLAEILFEQLAIARGIVEDRHQVVPAWHIATPEGAFLVLTRFDPDKGGRRERALLLVSRFMAWKMATSFVLTAETWLGADATRLGEEALIAVGISRNEQFAVIQRVRRRHAISFDAPESLAREHLDDAYFKLLPAGRTEITAEEIAELARIFGEGGELAAERLS